MSEHRHIRSLGVARDGSGYFFGYDEPPPNAQELRLDTLYTGFSAGTELTFFKQTNPYLRASWDAEFGIFQSGQPGTSLPLPFLGYMEVARVAASRAAGFVEGNVVAGTFGHKTGHIANPTYEILVGMPADIDPVLGIYAAQMGPIAANGILHADAEAFGAAATVLGCGVAGRSVVVNGAGVVGLLVALFAMRAGAGSVVVADSSSYRRGIAEALGFAAMIEAAACQHAKAGWHHGIGDRGADFVFQTRAHGASLHAALRTLRPQGCVIDLAFYQGGADDLRLGEEFHHNGLAIRCAQIGRVPRGLGYRWDRNRLATETIGLLRSHGPAIRQHMITHIVPFDDAPAFLAELARGRTDFVQIVFKVAA